MAYLPSPTQSVWHLGPLPIHAYALCIVAGIAVALWVAANRWRTAGGREGDLWDVSCWAIVFGIIGGRLYHVISDPELYFKHGEYPLNALKIWDGGLGIWSLPWGLRLHCLDIISGHATPFGTADGGQVCHGSATVAGLFQPTFLYESVWDVSLALILIWVSRRWRLGSGRLFAI